MEKPTTTISACRNVLAGIGALPAPPAATLAGTANATDLPPRILNEWREARAEWMAAYALPGAGNDDTPAEIEARDRHYPVEATICRTVAT